MATALPRKMFVNLPVRDLNRSIGFFKKLGFRFDPRFTDEQATCMIVGGDAYVMLLQEDRFKDFARKPIADAMRGTEGIFALSADSRAEVDELVNTALSNGGKPAAEKQEEPFMYTRSFYDLDGHHWEAVYMDPRAVDPESVPPPEAQADS
jgi:uncharacterized protein